MLEAKSLPKALAQKPQSRPLGTTAQNGAKPPPTTNLKATTAASFFGKVKPAQNKSKAEEAKASPKSVSSKPKAATKPHVEADEDLFEHEDSEDEIPKRRKKSKPPKPT